MTLDQLKVLCTIVEQGSFRAAAERLNRSQSALSIAIRKLEEEFRIQLFSRDQYRPVLTEEGRSLYDKAKTVLRHSAEFAHLAQHFAMGEEPYLRLALSAVFPLENIMGLLNQVMQDAPATQLSLMVENLYGTVERLDEGEVDLAIGEFLPEGGEYEHVVIGQVEFIAVLSPLSPLASRLNSLGERDLEDTVQVIVRDTSRRSVKKTVGVLPEATQWVVNDFNMKKRILASGMGWGRMARHMIEQELENGELLMIDTPDFPPITAQMKLIRRKHTPVGPVATKLWHLLQNVHLCCERLPA